MNGLTISIIASSLAGIGGTGIGAVIAIFLEALFNRNHTSKTRDNFIKLFMGFSAGIMIVIICFELIPASIDYSGFKISTFAVIMGCLTIPIFEFIFNRYKILKENKSKNVSGSYLKVSYLMFISIALHNFPEGLAVGTSFSALSDFGFTIALIVALHNIPEGIALSTPMMAAKMSNIKIIFLSMLVGIPTVVGAMLGWFIGGISTNFIGICLGFAGGAMIYIVIGQLFPISFKERYAKGTVSMILFGFFLGLLIVNL